MIESPIQSDYVLVKIGEAHWAYIGTKRAERSDMLSAMWSEAKLNQRLSLLATASTDKLCYGPATGSGRVIYAGASDADFLCRLRLFENTDYYWEIFSCIEDQLCILPEDAAINVASSISAHAGPGVRWDPDNRQARGTFNFGNYLGAAWLGFSVNQSVRFEVISAKLDYESQYLALLSDLTKQSLLLLFDPDAPTAGTFTEKIDVEEKTPLEQFLLLQAAMPLDELKAAIAVIKQRPHGHLESERRWIPASAATGEFASRDPIAKIRWGRCSVDGRPVAIEVVEQKRRDSVDTPPNRFVKAAIAKFMLLCREIRDDGDKYGSRLSELASKYHAELDQQSRSSFVLSAGIQSRIPFDNQVLQKREGYRQYLRAWIVSGFGLSAKDVTSNGVLSPTAENRAVPDLYEYWLFFFLAETIEGMESAVLLDRSYVSELNPNGKSSVVLSKSNAPKLVLLLRRGDRSRYVCLYYNRTFSRGDGYTSYSVTLRPDYTVETFPELPNSSYPQCREAAEQVGDISYLHFDAKFRIDTLSFVSFNDADLRPNPASVGAKAEDVYKMHTYNEAIRGTAASVILFPGSLSASEGLTESYQKYVELIPGVGALAVKPGDEQSRTAGISVLRDFIESAFNLLPKSNSQFAKFKSWEKGAFGRQ